MINFQDDEKIYDYRAFIKDKIKALSKRYEEQGRLLPDGVHYLDSWIDEKVEIFNSLMESDSLELLEVWVDR